MYKLETTVFDRGASRGSQSVPGVPSSATSWEPLLSSTMPSGADASSEIEQERLFYRHAWPPL